MVVHSYTLVKSSCKTLPGLVLFNTIRSSKRIYGKPYASPNTTPSVETSDLEIFIVSCRFVLLSSFPSLDSQSDASTEFIFHIRLKKNNFN